MCNVIGFYDGPGQAQQALNALAAAGICEYDVMGELAARDGNLDDHLTEFGIDRHSAHFFAEAVRHGKVLVNVRSSIERADEALQILKRNGAQEFEDLIGSVPEAAEAVPEQQPEEAPPEIAAEGEAAAPEEKAETAPGEQPAEQQAQAEEGAQAAPPAPEGGEPQPVVGSPSP